MNLGGKGVAAKTHIRFRTHRLQELFDIRSFQDFDLDIMRHAYFSTYARQARNFKAQHWSFFFANLMTTSSVSKDEVGDDAEADFNAASKASEGRTIVISLFALDWMRQFVNIESSLIFLELMSGGRRIVSRIERTTKLECHPRSHRYCR